MRTRLHRLTAATEAHSLRLATLGVVAVVGLVAVELAVGGTELAALELVEGSVVAGRAVV